MREETSVELLLRWQKSPDQQAAQELVRRYMARLIGLARTQLSAKMNRRVDPEDVAQSVFRTLFLRIRDGRLVPQPGDGLWQLLATLAMRAVLRKVEHHRAGKRSLEREESWGEGEKAAPEKVDPHPAPADVLILQEILEQSLVPFEPLHRQMVEWHLEGVPNDEIAERSCRSDRLVRLVLERFRENLGRQLGRD